MKKTRDKKTVLYQVIDGHKIVTGFDRPTVDAVATNAIVSEAKKDTDEYQAAEAKKAEYAEAVNELSTLQKKYKKGAKISREDQELWNHALGKMSVRQDELRPLARDLDNKIVALRREHAVYFEPRAGEVVRDASEVDKLIQAIQDKEDGTVIDLDGGEVYDNRGVIFFRKSDGKWGRTQIVKLGDKIPGDAVTEPDEKQRGEIERDRVAGLPSDKKASEKKDAMDTAFLSASGMRGELEIKSDSDALKKSQDWYKAEVKRIDGLYE